MMLYILTLRSRARGLALNGLCFQAYKSGSFVRDANDEILHTSTSPFDPEHLHPSGSHLLYLFQDLLVVTSRVKFLDRYLGDGTGSSYGRLEGFCRYKTIISMV